MRGVESLHRPSGFSVERLLLATSQVVLAVYLLAVYWRGEESYVLIHDNLDSTLIWLRLLGQQGADYFGLNTTAPNLLNGLPLFSLSPGVNVGELAHLFLGTLQAIIFNEAISRYIAFWGMFLLLRRHILKDHSLASIGVSLCFALLPFWPAGFLSVSGQPLVLYAFLNLCKGEDQWSDWLIIVAYPFYSNLVLAGFALVLLLAALAFAKALKSRRLNFRYLAGLVIFCSLYLVANYRLVFATFMNEAFVSHRAEFKAASYSLDAAARLIRNNFMFGQYHAASLHGVFILASVAIAFMCLMRWRRSPRLSMFLGLLLSCLAISLFYGVWRYFKPSLPDHLLLRGFQWERLHFLHPMFWHLLFAVSLGVILEKAGKFRSLAASLVLALICSQAVYALQNCDALREKANSGLTYAGFFSEPLFDDIAKFIDRPKESFRVASLGLHPSVAQYNGFYTLDGYVANYPLDHKHSFRKIIAGELAKSPYLKRKFDNWGSRCYLFSAEIGYSFLNQKESPLAVRNLQIDADQFRQMGGRYIFSAVPVLNCRANGLSLRRVFERDDSPWRIWLYEVDPHGGASA